MILAPSEDFPALHLTLNFKDGSGGDPDGLAGVSCLTNRMLLRGSRRRSRKDMEDAIEQLGTELITWSRRDVTSLSAAVLTRHLDRFLGLVSEVLCEPAFETVELDKVRREMLAELDTIRDDDAQLARVWFRRLVYGHHAFSNDPGGTTAGLNAITMADVRSCHESLYRRERLVIGASGDFEPSQLEHLVDTTLSALPTHGCPREVPPIRPHGPDEVRVALIEKPARSQAQILVGQRMPAASHPDFLTLKLAISAFGGNFTSRLMQELRVKRGLTYGVHAWLGGDRHGGMLLMGGAAEAQRGIEALEVMLAEYERFVEHGLTEDELNFIRDHHIRALPFSRETAALEVAQRMRAHLEGRRSMDLAELELRLKAISTDDVRSAIQRHCRIEQTRVVVVGSDDAGLLAGLEGLMEGSRVLTKDYRDPL